jgi:hypothetical protein
MEGASGVFRCVPWWRRGELYRKLERGFWREGLSNWRDPGCDGVLGDIDELLRELERLRRR